MNQEENSQLSTKHMLSILKAAKPHLASDMGHSIEILLKADELFSTFQHPPEKQAPLSAMGLGTPHHTPVDMEGLLTDIQKVCYPAEKENINMILNLIKAQRLYRSYQFYRQQDTEKEAGSGSAFDFLKHQLSPEQQNTFEMMRMFLQNPDTERSPF